MIFCILQVNSIHLKFMSVYALDVKLTSKLSVLHTLNISVVTFYHGGTECAKIIES